MSYFVFNYVICFGKISYIKLENKFYINVCFIKYEFEIFKWIIDILYMFMKVLEKLCVII